MKRDTIKTLVGLVIIGVIVVATFLYGNAQRQAQMRRDQAVKKQQAADQTNKAQPSGSASPAAGGSPTPTAASNTPTPTSNTAPVKSPGSNSLQGTGGSAQPSPQAGQVAGAQTNSPAQTNGGAQTNAAGQANAQIPQTGGSGAATPGGLPETGAPVAGLLGVTAIGVMMLAVRRSKRAIFNAARIRR